MFIALEIKETTVNPPTVSAHRHQYACLCDYAFVRRILVIAKEDCPRLRGDYRFLSIASVT